MSDDYEHSVTRLSKRLEEISRPFKGLNIENTAINRLNKRIAEQQNVIASIKVPDFAKVHQPELKAHPINMELEGLPHPAHETNKRLERIESHFLQMHGIATEAAAIATDLQGAAASFLGKFERAASDNDRTASWAIRIGAAAIMLAVLMPLAQILYTELWRVPRDSAAAELALTSLKTEIINLREEQAAVVTQLASAFQRTDRDSAQILVDIRDLLAASTAKSASAPP